MDYCRICHGSGMVQHFEPSPLQELLQIPGEPCYACQPFEEDEEKEEDEPDESPEPEPPTYLDIYTIWDF